jgi:phosphatidylserine/phosphatidylglycerophosphate/cardiolipin synthase-like enzyme
MTSIVDVPRNAFVTAAVEQSGVLIDARDYYGTLYRALEQARRQVVISGWQFESGIRLLRGQDAAEATRPVKLLEYLNALCEERPELEVYILAWDYSFVYAQDREPEQRQKFTALSSRIRFEWDAHPSVAGSHHQKFVVVDGALGFTGGIDLCDARWDDCDHRSHNPERVNVTGEPCKPYHDVQACFRGSIVASLVGLFSARWQRATGETLTLAAEFPEGDLDRFDLRRLSQGQARLLPAERAALSRTQVDSRANPERIGEILNLYSTAILAAERVIYIETQYFTSRSIAEVLIAQMQDAQRPQLDVVVVLPHGADTAMEKYALEDTQEGVLLQIQHAARDHGHQVQLLYPASHDPCGNEISTFIHSKLLIVDDRLLIVGSANFTERSVALDSELAISWECIGEAGELGRAIRDIRCTLLAEHSGVPEVEFEQPLGLCARLGELLERGDTRLRRREVVAPGPLGSLLAAVFDPGDARLTRAAPDS